MPTQRLTLLCGVHMFANSMHFIFQHRVVIFQHLEYDTAMLYVIIIIYNAYIIITNKYIYYCITCFEVDCKCGGLEQSFLMYASC